MFGLKRRNQWPTTLQGDMDQLLAAIREFFLVAHEEDGTLRADAVSVESLTGLPVGIIVGFGGTTAPSGWMLCNGTAISRSTFASLFDAIGTTYGIGDGSTTFNIPDLRGKYPLGKAAAGTGSTLGGTFGTLDHKHPLTQQEVQAGVGVTVASGIETDSQNVATAVINYIILVS